MSDIDIALLTHASARPQTPKLSVAAGTNGNLVKRARFHGKEAHASRPYLGVNALRKLTLRYQSRLLHIGMGARHKGLAVLLLVADRDVRVVSAADGELLRHLTLDPTRNYQRQSA
jgi:hypothetical protein